MDTKKLLHRYPLLIMLVAFIVASVAVSCGSNPEIDRQLTKAEEIMERHPDSAYIILKGTDYEVLSIREQKARYALILAKANMYMGRSLVTDTIIPFAINFYKDSGDTTAYTGGKTMRKWEG